MAVSKMQTKLVEKPWGRTNIDGIPESINARIGELWFELGNGPRLPLLVKYIFTSENLSIQVHPDDDQGQAAGYIGGKEECWYVLDAQDGARLGIGTTRPLHGDELRAAALDGSLGELIDWRPISAGDFYFIPAGTVHAIGADVALLEVQQNVDVTYRLFDYGRPRELHLDEGVAVSRAKPYDLPAVNYQLGCEAVLMDGQPFSMELRRLKTGEAQRLECAGNLWFIPISGQGTLDDSGWNARECWLIDGPTTLTALTDTHYAVAWL